MTDEPDVWAMTPEQAGAALEKLSQEFHGPAPSATASNGEQAAARLRYLHTDKDFAERFGRGDAAAVREWSELTKQVAKSNGTLRLWRN